MSTTWALLTVETMLKMWEKKKSHYLKVGKMSAIEYPSRWPSTPSPPTKHTAITKEVNLIMNNKMAI